MAEIKSLLDEVIEAEITRLGSLQSDDEQKSEAIKKSHSATQAPYRRDQGKD